MPVVLLLLLLSFALAEQGRPACDAECRRTSFVGRILCVGIHTTSGGKSVHTEELVHVLALELDTLDAPQQRLQDLPSEGCVACLTAIIW